ncbi:CU044_5270 family protein [Streptomyces neyagawaensis]|uniref:CU044_5270 family protein n=1 Tax=Streptomyces neyagawaensis TaxID=42238 RepID=UPI0006E42DAA|nr:CU044_5270 family protein [Streptomyces neyagawaensis]MCL6736368.1 CU044_5270 family protein [Streptomyces neyagawaensis]MDE1686010.1 CU044_5270 family protein [Streptomyces neyagawaensis]
MNENPSPHDTPSPPEATASPETESSPEVPAAVERELPPGRHRVLREQLMREIENRTESADTSRPVAVRPLWRRPAFAAPAVAAALTVAVVVGSAVIAEPPAPSVLKQGDPSGGTLSDRRAAEVLERAAEAVGKRKQPAIEDDQFVYIKQEDYHWKLDEDLMRSDCDSTDEGHPFGTREFWRSVDGKHAGLARDEQFGERRLHVLPRMKGFITSYRQAEDELPDGVEGMYRYLYGAKAGKEPKAGDRRADRKAFAKGAELLAGQLLPPKEEVALYRALARIPGLTVYEGARDTVGRSGVSVGIAGWFNDFGQGRSRYELLFDERTSAFLAFNSVNLNAPDGDCESLRVGDLVSSAAILKRGVVDRTGERP